MVRFCVGGNSVSFEILNISFDEVVLLQRLFASATWEIRKKFSTRSRRDRVPSGVLWRWGIKIMFCNDLITVVQDLDFYEWVHRFF